MNWLQVFSSTCVAEKLIHCHSHGSTPPPPRGACTCTTPASQDHRAEMGGWRSTTETLPPWPSLTLSSSPAVSPGVVTAVVFISVCALAAISRLLYQHRQAQRSSGGGAGSGSGGGGGGGGIKDDNRHSMYTDYRTELHLHNSVRDNMKEYYI